MLGTLEQLRSYTNRSAAGSAAGLRTVAAEQSAMLCHVVRGENRPAARPAPAAAPARRSITIRELNSQLAQLPIGPKFRSRFALRRKDGDIDFFELRAYGGGRFMLYRLHGAPGGFQARTMPVQLQHFAALHIAEDLPGAAKLFGDEVGECSRCGSALTNADSRRIGLGPRCRESYGV